MERLVETSYELNQLQSRKQMNFGLHLGQELAVNAAGLPVMEMQFDPSVHDVEAIDPFSMGELMTGMPYVQKVIPFRPVEANVILHDDSQGGNLPQFLEPIRKYKWDLATSLADSIKASVGFGDKAKLYVIGDPGEYADRPDIEVVNGSEKPELARDAALNICRRGISFLISDFNTLNFGNDVATRQAFRETVAIKANHAHELALPANAGDYPLDGSNTVNTHKPKELARANALIAEKHQAVIKGLHAAGLGVVQLTYNDARHAPTDSDVKSADKPIAAAIRDIKLR